MDWLPLNWGKHATRYEEEEKRGYAFVLRMKEKFAPEETSNKNLKNKLDHTEHVLGMVKEIS